ncbi:MAG: type II secretion system ATPase GspE [Armatimonadota bacterium]|nr:type II secretion system ATPase GspE [Armatimonadota bacterium]
MAELRVTVRNRSGCQAHHTIMVEVGEAAGRPAGGPEDRPPQRRVRLGQILLEAGIITQAQLKDALTEQQKTGERIGVVIQRLGLGSQEGVARALAQQLGLEFVRLGEVTLDEATLLRVPKELARRFQVIPLRVDERQMLLGMVDPLDILAVDDLRRLTGLEVAVAVMTPDDFQRALSQYPTVEGSVSELIQQIGEPAAPGEEPPTDRLRDLTEEAPVIRLVNLIILQAVRQGASDIHIEPQDRVVRVRYRLDGHLHAAMSPPRHVYQALISRIKIMAHMNIADRRVPQDGRIDLKVDGRDISFRVSTTPTVFGEKAVLRILDKRNALVGVDRLGLAPHDARSLEQMISRPHGIILVTGPTGSGKTTTLYAILNRLNRPEVNILTIEDPVEYQHDGIAQVQVNPKAGLTFASGLRAFLRQDPDIIMVGEIRDEETARIAIHAALTGHLVLSTLHTNDAPSAVTRLVDMGIEPFLVSSSLVGVVAQRLVRVLCERCREPYHPLPEVLTTLGVTAAGHGTFYRPVGCAACSHTGYRGRVGIFEILTVDESIKALIVRHATDREIRVAARSAGMRTLQEDGLAKVASGTTSLEEILRTVFVEGDLAPARTLGTDAVRPEPGAGSEPSADGGQPSADGDGPVGLIPAGRPAI